MSGEQVTPAEGEGASQCESAPRPTPGISMNAAPEGDR